MYARPSVSDGPEIFVRNCNASTCWWGRVPDTIEHCYPSVPSSPTVIILLQYLCYSVWSGSLRYQSAVPQRVAVLARSKFGDKLIVVHSRSDLITEVVIEDSVPLRFPC